MTTKIEWTDETFNPIRARNRATGKVGWHCEHVTPGCEHCYSETMNRQLGTGLPFKLGHREDIELFLDEKTLMRPLRWKRPRKIFVCSMTDLFADFVPDDWIDKIFAVMALCPQHSFQVLTKRPERMRQYMTEDGIGRVGYAESLAKRMLRERSGRDDPVLIGKTLRWPLSNVWLGASIEDQKRADERIPHLLNTPAAVRFLSCEPLLGPIDLDHLWTPTHRFSALIGQTCERVPAGTLGSKNGLRVIDPFGPRLDWIIVGGESGPRARPMHPDWARSIRDQCQAAGVAFFFKQWGEWCRFENHHYFVSAWRKRWANVSPTGEVEYDPCGISDFDPDAMIRVGKRTAGRQLDGRTWNEYPDG